MSREFLGVERNLHTFGDQKRCSVWVVKETHGKEMHRREEPSFSRTDKKLKDCPF